jgi:hypothetical protein
MEKSPVFDQTIRSYLEQLRGCDFRLLEDKLGLRAERDAAEITLLGVPYRVSAQGIAGPGGRPPHTAVGVILSKYVMMCPGFPPIESDWVSFRDFRDAAPLIGAFANTVEALIAREFSGHAPLLRQAAATLGARPPAEGYPYDLSLVVPALPRVPLLLLFNDADAEFPPACSVLFERRAEHYLDMECLAMTGMLLADTLVRLRQGAESHEPLGPATDLNH